MAKGNNQKLKILYLMKILLEKTDEKHSLTMPEIISALAKQGISAERKSIYSDIENLRSYGVDIIDHRQDGKFCYHIGSRDFELAELKLLVDSVQAAKFITVKKSQSLIKKLEGLVSRYDAVKLQRQVFVAERIKTMNESIYYNVDVIHSAIGSDSKISFKYFQWDVNKEMVLRRNGERYEVSPWALSWDDENYYLVAFDKNEDKIKHFRVDKMLNISICDDRRDGRAVFEKFDMAVYAKKMFGMFGGEEQRVKLKCRNDFAGIFIDRFGKDLPFMKDGEEHFTVNVDVAVSRQFFAWIISLGEGVEIIEPVSVKEKMKEEIKELAKRYDVR